MQNHAEPSESFAALVRSRRSIRSFLPAPLSQETLLSVLEDARRAPSNSNIQPWLIHIVSGETRDRLSAAMLEADDAGAYTPDFPWGYDALTGAYSTRQKAQGASYFQALGIAREASDDRREAVRRNLSFFGAPHACLLFMPSFYDNVRVAGDVGMFAQTFLLSLAAHGLAGVPQTYLGMFADQTRAVLDVAPDHKLLFGISFGRPDETSAAGRFKMDRAPVAEFTKFHS